MPKITFSFAVISLLYQSEHTKKTEVYTSTYNFCPEDFTMESLIAINEQLISADAYISCKRASLLSVVVGVAEDKGLNQAVTFTTEELNSLNDTKSLLGHRIKLDTLKSDCMKIVEWAIKMKQLEKVEE